MKKYFVIGNPIDHSLSPKLHNHWINDNKIKAIYHKKKLANSEVEDFILNKKDTIQKISNHISYNINLNKNEFNFSKSQKNIGRYKENLKNSEIEVIENQLKEFLNY